MEESPTSSQYNQLFAQYIKAEQTRAFRSGCLILLAMITSLAASVLLLSKTAGQALPLIIMALSALLVLAVLGFFARAHRRAFVSLQAIQDQAHYILIREDIISIAAYCIQVEDQLARYSPDDPILAPFLKDFGKSIKGLLHLIEEHAPINLTDPDNTCFWQLYRALTTYTNSLLEAQEWVDYFQLTQGTLDIEEITILTGAIGQQLSRKPALPKSFPVAPDNSKK